MRVTKAMLEDTNASLRESIEKTTRENFMLKEQMKHLNGVIDLYSRTPSLLIATERITEALTRTIERMPR